MRANQTHTLSLDSRKISNGASFFVGYLLYISLLFCVFPYITRAETVQEQRARLEQQLADIEKDIDAKKGNLTALQNQRASLERDVNILDAKIATAKLSIKQRDLTITKIRGDIRDKEDSIVQIDDRVAKSEASLAQLIRRTREIDDMSLAELALREGNVADLFSDVDNFQQIQSALDVSFKEMAILRSDLSSRKLALQDQQVEEQDLRQIQVLQKQAIEKDEKEKQDLVKATKGTEKAYQTLIKNQEQSAAQIRAALFGLRDTSAIKFGDALGFAKEASAKTGVRPAIILGILAEESNLGENVGTGNWKVDMHPTRDQPVFQQITAELGLDPDKMPVSKKAWYGWGGAMGPAQFIPSTWVQYKSRISDMTGQKPPDPWDARTAIYATAILMMDNGADAQTPAAERLAALRYLAGWKNANKAAYSFYGDDVMDLAAKFQQQINVLGG